MNSDFLVAHLHGFLPAPERSLEHFNPDDAPVVLAEDDYHAVSADVSGWTNRELHRLFDQFRVLIIGMSLVDPNLRRVLATLPKEWDNGEIHHFAVVKQASSDDLALPRVRAATKASYTQRVGELRSQYWQDRGVAIVEIPGYDSVLPVIVRLRYESYGVTTGDLWRRGAELGYSAIDPWRADRQILAHRFLADATRALSAEFLIADSMEIVEIGIFLVNPDGVNLELVFRGGGARQAVPGGRQFSVDPDRPTGVAGRVFVSGDLVRVSRSHSLYNFGLGQTASQSSSGLVAGIVSAPIIDWQAGGVPLGVVYMTTRTDDGITFKLRPRNETRPGERSLDALYNWLADAAMTLISSFR